MNTNKNKIYYGWWIVVSGFFLSLYTTGVINFGFTAVFEPLVKEFGWSYTEVSLAASLRGLETGLLAPLVGYLTDKWGTRKLLAAGTVLLGAGLVVLSQVQSLLMFYLAYFLIAVGISTCGGTLFLAAVVNWFRKEAAIASGLLTSGVAMGGLMVPVVALAVDGLGWRLAMFYCALGTWIICLPLALVFKEKPQEVNLQHTHHVQISAEKPTSNSKEDNQPSMSPGQALKSKVFWHISLALIIQLMVVNAVITHVMPYLSSLGFNRTTASLAASAIPIFSILGRLGFGWLGEKHNKLFATALGYFFTCLGLLFFALIEKIGVWAFAPFFICLGLGWGSCVPMRVTLVREYFGRERFATIHGFVIGAMMLGNIAGPPIAGLVFDNTGSYQNIWYIFAAVAVLAGVIILTAPPLKKA